MFSVLGVRRPRGNTCCASRTIDRVLFHLLFSFIGSLECYFVGSQRELLNGNRKLTTLVRLRKTTHLFQLIKQNIFLPHHQSSFYVGYLVSFDILSSNPSWIIGQVEFNEFQCGEQRWRSDSGGHRVVT